MIDREALRRDAQIKTKEVHVPEWNATFTIRQLKTEHLLKSEDHDEDDKLGGARQIVASVINNDGELEFTAADIPELISYSAAGFLRLNTAINEFNGMGNKAANLKK